MHPGMIVVKIVVDLADIALYLLRCMVTPFTDEGTGSSFSKRAGTSLVIVHVFLTLDDVVLSGRETLYWAPLSKSERVFLTGGSGRIGRRVEQRLLERGYGG